MEVIQLAGYTEAEKLEIAKRYLVPAPDRAQRPDQPAGSRSPTPALRAIIADYTREAGVRQLEREIGAVAARSRGRWPRAGQAQGEITEPRVRELLGKRRFFSEARRRTSRPGVATGLAWTPVGGEVLFIEATSMPGQGGLTITGQLGDVMKESAQAALSYVRSQRRRAVARSPRGLVRHARHPHPRPRRRDPQGRSQRRGRDGHRAGVAAVRAGRCAPTSR